MSEFCDGDCDSCIDKFICPDSPAYVDPDMPDPEDLEEDEWDV